MAIIINIDVMLAKRKMSVTELTEKVGITMANLSILKNGKAKAVRFSAAPRAAPPALRCFGGAAEPLAPARCHAAGFVYLRRDFNSFLFGPFPCMPNDQCDKHSFYNCIQQGVGGDL